MSRTRLVLLSLVATMSIGALLASTASAAIKFEWRVEGKKLEAGKTKEFTTTSDGHLFTLTGTIAGAAIKLLSTEVSVEPGAEIIGGTPGTNKETVLYKGVTVDKEHCVVESEGEPTGTVQTHALLTTIVESEGTHEPVILFAPELGTIFTSLLILNKSSTETCVGAGLANVTGTLLAQPLPELKEVENGDLDFEAPNSNYVLSNGTLDKSGLVFGGNAATLTGLALVILTSKEVYGAF